MSAINVKWWEDPNCSFVLSSDEPTDHFNVSANIVYESENVIEKDPLENEDILDIKYLKCHQVALEHLKKGSATLFLFITTAALYVTVNVTKLTQWTKIMPLVLGILSKGLSYLDSQLALHSYVILKDQRSQLRSDNEEMFQNAKKTFRL